MSYLSGTKRCVNDRHNVGPISANESTCWKCEEDRYDRIAIALMVPVTVSLVVAFTGMLYAAIGWWVLAVFVAAGWVYRHRTRTGDLLERFGGWVQRVCGFDGEVSS